MQRDAVRHSPAGHRLDLAQQLVRDLDGMEAPRQGGAQVVEEARRHLGVGQRPVVTARDRQAVELDQVAELVARRLRMDAARQQQRAGELLPAGASRPRQLGVPETAIERGVVGDQRMVADEIGRLRHHPGRRWRASQHLVADARQGLDEGRHPRAGVHQALVAIHDLTVAQEDHADLRGASAGLRRHAGGFEVDDGDGIHGMGDRSPGAAARPDAPDDTRGIIGVPWSTISFP